jgi:hypothetical protein
MPGSFTFVDCAHGRLIRHGTKRGSSQNRRVSQLFSLFGKPTAGGWLYIHQIATGMQLAMEHYALMYTAALRIAPSSLPANRGERSYVHG